MKAHDKFFLASMIGVLIQGMITAYFVYPTSPIASYFALLLGTAMAVGVRMDWLRFRKRHEV